MSFSGDLEHFPLVDVIQLLHSTRKSGTLTLTGLKGESQLIFNDGYFVGANHLNNSVRIGQVLLEMGVVSQDSIDTALNEQKRAGGERKPLVATLLEQQVINKDVAFKGLETLIGMTIVEVLTWKSGSFSLDISKLDVSDDYRYFPEKLHHEILLNAQGILMDALRIYDEKMRDGTLSDLFFNENVPDTEQEQSGCDNSNGGITADLLGLDELDTITRKIPDVFIGLKDEDPAGEHRKIVDNSLPDTPDEQRGKLVQFLSDLFRSAETTSGLAVILLSRDELLAHGISTVCRHDGVFVFATDVEQALDIIIEQSLGRDLHPLLLLDGTHEDSTEALMTLVQQKIVAYPQISVMITSCSPHIQNISMRALAAGTGTVMPRPCPQCHGEEYIQQLITFLSSLGQFFTKTDPLSTTEIDRQFVAALKQVKAFFEPPEIALLLLNFTATQFERVITFVVAKSELIAEKSIGVTGNKSKGPSPPLMFRIPLADHSLLQEVAEKGELYYGLRSDSALTTFLYKEIGAPRSPKTLLLPLISRGKVIALIYADFGSRAVSPPRIPLLEALAHYGAAILDNALYRKSLEKTA